MTAPAISFRPRIVAGLLVFAEDASLLASGFVHAFDGFTPPTRPVEVFAQLGQSERMSGTLNLLDAVVNGQSVGPTQFRRNNGRTSRSIQEWSLNRWVLAPIRPVEQPAEAELRITT